MGEPSVKARLLLSSMLLVTVSCGPDAAAGRMALMQADSAFAAETAARGADGWADFFLEDAVQFPGTGRIDGREAIRATMREVLTPDQPRLTWAPTEAAVGSGADLGYTLGRWQTLQATATGIDSVLQEGNYVTVWRKAPDGSWRVAVDIGNQDRH